MTTGGTESLLLACKAYRDWAYDRGIERPEMYVTLIFQFPLTPKSDVTYMHNLSMQSHAQMEHKSFVLYQKQLS